MLITPLGVWATASLNAELRFKVVRQCNAYFRDKYTLKTGHRADGYNERLSVSIATNGIKVQLNTKMSLAINEFLSVSDRQGR